jgi:hypothetical protein
MKNSSITIRTVGKWTGYLLLLVLPGTLLLLPLAAWWLYRRGAARRRAVNAVNLVAAELCDRTQA